LAAFVFWFLDISNRVYTAVECNCWYWYGNKVLSGKPRRSLYKQTTIAFYY